MFGQSTKLFIMKAEKTAVMSSKNCWSFRKAKANFSQQGKAGTSPENGVK